jgi:hypothetical protein
MPNVNVNIEIFCDCGEGLCNQSVGGDGSITVSPCERCVEEARSESYNDGYDAGYEDGYKKCYKDNEK